MTRVLTYTLTLQEPCLLAAPGGDPNTEASLSYIPGGVVRGALAAAYARPGEQNNDKEFTSLFLDGRVRYLNAYPLLDGRRTMPTPRAWTKLKDKEEDVYNRAEKGQFDAADKEIPAGVGAEFVTFAESIHKPKVEFEIAVHTARNREKGRSLEGDADSALFRYRALAREQSFIGAIVIEDGADGDLIKKLLKEQQLFLGGSHMAGYGRVGVELAGHDQPETWREVDGQAKDIAAGNTFIVYLSSHAVLYDQTGQPTSDILLFLPGAPGDYDIVHSFAAAGWVGGFNKQRGLPLSQQWALQMGSTWVIKAKRPISAAEIAALERKGIGARTEEGFGRLVINPQWPQAPFQIEGGNPGAAPSQGKQATEVELDAAGRRLLEGMNKRIARAELDRRLAVKVNELADKDKVRGRLSPSQLGRLQVRIRREAGKTGFKDFLDYLEGTRKRKSADDQFRKYTVAGRNFRDLLEELAGKPLDSGKTPGSEKNRTTVWGFLGEGAPPSIGSGGFDFKSDELTGEYTVKFIANLCRQLSKLEREP